MKFKQRILIYYFVLLGLIAFLQGCGRVEVVGGTTHTVGGEANVNMNVDIGLCGRVLPEKQNECFNLMAELLVMLQEGKEKKTNVPQILEY